MTDGRKPTHYRRSKERANFQIARVVATTQATKAERKAKNRAVKAEKELFRTNHLTPEALAMREQEKSRKKAMSRQMKKAENNRLRQQYAQCNNHHTFAASATKLLEITCIRCSKPAFRDRDDDYQTRLLKYLSSRRKRRILENLYSLMVPLHTTSFLQMQRIALENGIESNTATLHLTLLEGVCPQVHFQLSHVRNLLFSDPCIVVKNFRTIPTTRTNPMKVLVMAVLHLSSQALVEFLKSENVVTRLPQWDWHIALGVIDQGQAEETALQKLKEALLDKSLRVWPDHVALLPSQQQQRAENGVGNTM